MKTFKDLKDSNYICHDCGSEHLSIDDRGKAVDGFMASCGLCSRLKSVSHIKNYNYLGCDLENLEVLFPELGEEYFQNIPLKRGKAPSRNAPCNCGSGVKYKKCCGKPKFVDNETITLKAMQDDAMSMSKRAEAEKHLGKKISDGQWEKEWRKFKNSN